MLCVMEQYHIIYIHENYRAVFLKTQKQTVYSIIYDDIFGFIYHMLYSNQQPVSMYSIYLLQFIITRLKFQLITFMLCFRNNTADKNYIRFNIIPKMEKMVLQFCQT